MRQHIAHTIQRYFDELFNRGRTELVETLLHPEYQNHSPGSPDLPRGRDGVVLVVNALRAAFPDLHYSVEELIIDQDLAAVRSTLRGTQRGPFFAVPATGRRVEVPQITIERFRDGRIISHHRLTDELALMRQLGAL
jgi:steroid delta-isomerase-like uncharacterized protein